MVKLWVSTVITPKRPKIYQINILESFTYFLRAKILLFSRLRRLKKRFFDRFLKQRRKRENRCINRTLNSRVSSCGTNRIQKTCFTSEEIKRHFSTILSPYKEKVNIHASYKNSFKNTKRYCRLKEKLHVPISSKCIKYCKYLKTGNIIKNL